MNRRQFLWSAGSFAALGRAAVLPPLFREIPSSASGIGWVHENAMSPQRYLPETLGPGCAFLDYDNDSWMDIYLVNSGRSEFYQPKQPIRNALYRNNRDGTFTDVTEKAGVQGGIFGMGVAVGDYNNDGYPDLFVTGCGRSLLYHNNGDGTFTDVTRRAGLNIPGWTTSAVWFDFDNDGRLDLFVCNFVRYLPEDRLSCGDNGAGQKYYCIPRAFHPTASYLFHNNGDGTFAEVGHGTAIGRSFGKALGVVATDINNDGRMDLFVANDTVQNFLFVNRGGNQWEETALTAEVGFSESGQVRSGMGVDSADFDNDGWQDLFVANIDQEIFSLYRNLKNGTFVDVAQSQSIAQATRLLSGWGLRFFDYDNDGDVDLIIANGHPDDMVGQRSQSVKYREPLLLFQQKNGHFRDVSADAGPAFSREFSARGLAIGDMDNDGRLDVLIGVNGGAPLLLQNSSGAGNHWLGVKLQGTSCNRDAIGARLTWSAGGKKHSRQATGGGSYLSAHDPRHILGVGPATKLDWLEIRWPGPSLRIDRYTDLSIDRYISIVEGKGLS
ncbi:MAG TPA: CRTAC1 family protein [Candidatus Dormibacteraeota bacterium]|nr:CRTAC1 family protein [Candidatus Dormibacteraeota bacterium]